MKTKIASLGMGLLTVTLLSAPTLSAQPQEAQTPRSERRQEAIKQYDKNGDGQLDTSERKAVRERRRERGPDQQRGALPPEVLKNYDQDGDGKLSQEEARKAREDRRKQQEDLRKKYDKNGNGKLDPNERDALQADIQSGKVKAPQMRGRRGAPENREGSMRPERQRGSRGNREAVIKKFDQDGDGTLNEAERQEARKEFQGRRPGQRGSQSRD